MKSLLLMAALLTVGCQGAFRGADFGFGSSGVKITPPEKTPHRYDHEPTRTEALEGCTGTYDPERHLGQVQCPRTHQAFRFCVHDFNESPVLEIYAGIWNRGLLVSCVLPENLK